MFTKFEDYNENLFFVIWYIYHYDFYRFSKDPQTDSYSRTVFSVLDFFGNIGGLNEVLEKIGELIVTIFASRLFTFSIVANLYQVDTSPTGNFNVNYKIIIIKSKGIFCISFRDDIFLFFYLNTLIYFWYCFNLLS